MFFQVKNLFLISFLSGILTNSLFASNLNCVDISGTYLYELSSTCNLNKLKSVKAPLPMGLNQEMRANIINEMRPGVPFRIVQTDCSSFKIEVDYLNNENENRVEVIAMPKTVGEKNPIPAQYGFDSEKFFYKKIGVERGCNEAMGGSACILAKTSTRYQIEKQASGDLELTFKSKTYGIGSIGIIPIIEFKKSSLECKFTRIF